ncbi:MAG TPA: isoamylase [Acetobacteraceae bacterium]|nr:isoamylase [Acetobacteraceae bacterium]
MLDEWERLEGAPWPLGAAWIEEERAYNFAIYSKHADRVTLLLYGEHDFATPLRSIPFEFPRNKTNRVWHARVSAALAEGVRYYGYRVAGPYDPSQGQRFDDQKILLDPYTTGVFFPPGHDRDAACRPGSNAGQAPLGVLPPMQAVNVADRPAGPRYGHELVIYEMHVRGFTQRENSLVPDATRGRFAGVVAKIPYLQRLGVTAVELLPVQQFDPQEGNYWGYMTLNFFTPCLGYGQDGSPEATAAEFRHMVDELHRAGIEVFLDVVYNHTTEEGVDGPTCSFRGIDNSTYYALDPGDLATYANYSACGNDLRTAHPVVRQLVVSSLRYWVREMGVDGFRFDLASIFARDDNGAVNFKDPPIMSEIASDPDLMNTRLIAEPWQGESGGGYMMGRAFPGKSWSQWNDHFRDAVRGFVRGEPNLVSALMTRLYGSTDLFPDTRLDAFRRYQSVNYIDCHDGLNMCDLVSYTRDDQHSWDCGHAGSDGVPPDVAALRRQQIRNFCCLLMLSNGTPMFVAGDEFMQTQRGNANPWNQDNETTWLDWELAERNADVLRFFRMMIAFRKAHPSIGRSTGWGADVTWHGVGAAPDESPDSHSLAFHLRGAAAGDADIYVMVNAYWGDLVFAIQAPGPWVRIVDTSLTSPGDIVDATTAPAVRDARCAVAARSIVVLTSQSG